MNIFRSFEEASVIINPVVTTGSFDGVHIGHKTILKRLQLLAEKHHGESALITFHPHPRQVLYPETSGKDLKLINSQVEKLELLRKAGLNNVIIIEFTKDFSKITSDQFVRDFIHGILKAKVVVAGFNHHFGFNKEGDYRQLFQSSEKYNFETEEIPEQEVQHETVSSTKIRKAISEGYIQRANAWLDHYYIIMGIPEEHYMDYAKEPIVFFKVPLTEESKLLPAHGIYAVSAERDAYAYLFEWNEYYSPKALFKIQNAGLVARVATDEFTSYINNGKKKFSFGTIMVPAYGQSSSRDEIYKLMESIAKDCGITIYGVNTGLTPEGIDLGSGFFVVLKKPSVAMFVDDGINSGEAGEIWHLFDVRYNIPLTLVKASKTAALNLDRYNVIIFAGSPDINPAGVENIRTWNRKGGTIIAFENGNKWLTKNKFAEIEFIPEVATKKKRADMLTNRWRL